jgi:hypothetical protein
LVLFLLSQSLLHNYLILPSTCPTFTASATHHSISGIMTLLWGTENSSAGPLQVQYLSLSPAQLPFLNPGSPWCPWVTWGTNTAVPASLPLSRAPTGEPPTPFLSALADTVMLSLHLPLLGSHPHFSSPQLARCPSTCLGHSCLLQSHLPSHLWVRPSSTHLATI